MPYLSDSTTYTYTISFEEADFIKRFIACIITTISLICLCCLITAAAPAPADANGITGVRIFVDKRPDGSMIIPQEAKSRDDVKNNPNGIKLEITADISQSFASEHIDRSIYLFELEAWQNDDSISMSGAEPLDYIEIKRDEAFSHTFAVSIDLSSPNTKRLYSKFILGIKSGDSYIPVGYARYIDNTNAMSDVTEIPLTASTKKGLLVQSASDAKLLGIGHSTVKVMLNDFIASERGANTEEFKFGGESFYFNLDRIVEYDRKIKELSDEGIVVTAQLLLGSSSELEGIPKLDTPASMGDIGGISSLVRDTANMTPIQHIMHPKAVKEANTLFYGINTTDIYGVKYFTALMSFIADRYVRENTGYGRVSNVILGDEIGRAMKYNNCGVGDIDVYVRDYTRALRIVDTAIRSRHGGARVYISFDHFWNSLSAEGMPMNYEYKNKDLYDKICEYVLREGNFPWCVSYQASNEKIEKPDFWNELTTLDSSLSPLITFKNIETLCTYINDEMSSYLAGERRRIILTDQGFSSEMNTTEEKNLQAAAYALAYYKAAFIADIEAFTYQRQVDSTADNGRSFGLWTNAADSVSTPAEPKVIYDVFKYIDTPRSLEITNFAKVLIGINEWTEVIPAFTESALARRTLKSQVAETSKVGGNAQILFAFNSADLASFSFTGWSGSASCATYTGDGSRFDGKKNLVAAFTQKSPSDYSGIGRSYLGGNPLDLSAFSYITVELRVDAPLGVKDITAKLLMDAEDTTAGMHSQASYEGEAKFAAGKDVTLSFKLSDWEARGGVNALKLLVKPADNAVYEGDYNLVVSSISGVTVKSSAGAVGRFFRGLLIAVIIILVLAIAFVIFARYRAQVRHRQRQMMMQDKQRQRRVNAPSKDFMADDTPRLQDPRNSGQGRRPRLPPNGQGRPPQGQYGQGQGRTAQGQRPVPNQQAFGRPPHTQPGQGHPGGQGQSPQGQYGQGQQGNLPNQITPISGRGFTEYRTTGMDMRPQSAPKPQPPKSGKHTFEDLNFLEKMLYYIVKIFRKIKDKWDFG